MSSQVHSAKDIQQQYYADTAKKYNEMHLNERSEHYLALCFMLSCLEYFEIQTILDIGSGTGRTVISTKKKRPDVKIIGLEPVKELREIGYSQGLSKDELIEGDVTHLAFNSDQFDLVCAFGVLHHIRNSEKAVSEMLRVSRKAIFISDSNNFGQGSSLTRSIKQLINAFGVWSIANLIKTKGKGYTISEGDGLFYSYSVFNNYRQIKQKCAQVHLLNTRGGDINFYKTASHVALLAIKK